MKKSLKVILESSCLEYTNLLSSCETFAVCCGY